MANLVMLALLRGTRGRPKQGFQLGFSDLLDIWIPRTAVSEKAKSVKLRQCFDIGYEPSLHSLSHQMTVIVRKAVSIPLVTSM